MSNHAPFAVYVADISYFSGKFEAYLRYKEVPYQRVLVSHKRYLEVFRHTGAMKVPAVRTANDQWLKDTTPMIEWFEKEYPESPVLPQDPALAFVAYLLEDFADEWLWRPAMWWRWEPKVTRHALGRRIAQEILYDFPAPTSLMMHYFAWRQRRSWLWGDGMNKSNSFQIRQIYLSMLEAMQSILSHQPFLLGSHPSLADFGFFGPFFRHFGNDPDPAEMMRLHGPAVYEWTARLWNTKASSLSTEPSWVWPNSPTWEPIWKELVTGYLPYLHQNALAWKDKKARFDCVTPSISFPRTLTTEYRVWCRQELQRRWNKLPTDAKQEVDALFQAWGGIEETLLADGVIDAGLDEEMTVPFPPRPQADWKTRLKVALFGTARNTPRSPKTDLAE